MEVELEVKGGGLDEAFGGGPCTRFVLAFEEKTLLDLLNKKNGRLVARLVMIGVVSGRTILLLGGVDDEEE